jgi:hypothetical protein
LYVIRPIEPLDIDNADGSLLRQEDIQEITLASTFKCPTQALLASICYSDYTNVVYCLDTQTVIMYFGCAYYEGCGVPWMVATDAIYKYQKSLLKEAKDIVDDMLDDYGTLMNTVDKRNTKHIQWLKWMNFKFDKTKNTTIDGYEFLYFYQHKE